MPRIIPRNTFLTFNNDLQEHKELSTKLFELVNYDRKINQKPLLNFNEKVYQDSLKNSMERLKGSSYTGF